MWSTHFLIHYGKISGTQRSTETVKKELPEVNLKFFYIAKNHTSRPDLRRKQHRTFQSLNRELIQKEFNWQIAQAIIHLIADQVRTIRILVQIIKIIIKGN